MRSFAQRLLSRKFLTLCAAILLTATVSLAQLPGSETISIAIIVLTVAYQVCEAAADTAGAVTTAHIVAMAALVAREEHR